MARTSIRHILKLFGARTATLPTRSHYHTLEPKWVTVDDGPCKGVKLYISDAFAEMARGSYDRFIYDSLTEMQVDLSGATVWDVGAHLGYHSLALAKLVGSYGSVLAFEPNLYNRERLIVNLQANPELATRVEIFDRALSNEDSSHHMRISPEIDTAISSGSYLDYGSVPSDRHPLDIYDRFQIVNVKVVKADTFVRNGESAPPKFVKLDVEGAEVRVLQGAYELLSAYKPVLAIEVHNIQNMFHVHEVLRGCNYSLALLDDGVNMSSRCFVLALPAE